MTSTSLKALSECLDGEVPLAVRAVDLERLPEFLELPTDADGRSRYRGVVALLRRDGLPLGWIRLPVERDGRARLDITVSGRDAAAPPAGASTGGVTRPPGKTVAGQLLSVVLATCGDAAASVRCVEAILARCGGSCEVIVVENRPSGSTVGAALRHRFATDTRVRYVEERRRGLASARNAGLRHARGELVAFTDDDVIVDDGWERALRDAFAAPGVACVTGLIAPLEFESETQLMVERFASYGKGFRPRLYSLVDPPADEPLFPYAAGHFVSGANVAFRTATLRELGGFDEALGTGTPARGCEDLDVCIRLLLSGAQLAYEPRATVWHRHPDTPAQLRARAFDYGASLGALLTKHLLFSGRRSGLLRRAPRGARHFLDPSSRKNEGRGEGFPRGLVTLELAGLAAGPFLYLRSRRVNR